MPAVIKNVSKEIWRILRGEAIKHGVTTGNMLEILVREHVENERKRSDAWDMISKRKKPIITKKEAEIIRRGAEEFRKSFKMRV
ncbi:MAG: hypothetical protein HY051_01100 [Candidatus Aenigmarchaeota archaeon]|nr:hypothetical protein [Candidatus Aenigmarchaeota archaeon]